MSAPIFSRTISLTGDRTYFLGNPDPIINKPWSETEKGFFTLLIIVVIFAIVGLAYYFGFVKKGNTEGERCTKESECDAFLYCSGDFTCQRGSKGVTVGGTCSTSKDCDVNLTCQNEICKTVPTNGTVGQACNVNEECNEGLDCERGVCVNQNSKTTDLASFESSDIIYTDTNSNIYYLHVTSTGSTWRQNIRPTYTYSYSSSENSLFITGDNGNIVINNSGIMLRSTNPVSDNKGSFIRFFRQGQVMSFTDDSNNQISISSGAASGSGSNNDLAVFVDRSKYPNQSNLNMSSPVFVQINRR